MTIAYGSSASTGRNSLITPITWTHTPSGTPKAALVLLTLEHPYTERLVGITYGGVALSRVVRAVDSNGETGASEIWFLGSGVPTGASTVSASFNTTNTADRVHLTSITLTAAGDTEVVDFDSINGDTTDPSVTLQYGGRTCLALASQYGGASDPSAFVPNSNCTTVSAYDYFTQYSYILRQTTPGSADFTIGGTAALDDCAYTAVAIGEVATAPSQGTVVHVESSAFTVGSEVTSGKLVIPFTTQTGDNVLVYIASRGHNANTPYPSCTDNDTGGDSFALLTSTGDRTASIYKKSATSGTAGKTVTVSGTVSGAAAVCSVYRNANRSNPITNVTVSSIVTQNPTVAGFTPDNAQSMIAATVFNIASNNPISEISCGVPGSLISRQQCLNTVGCSILHASSLQTAGLAGTGNFHWLQSNASAYAITFALNSSSTTVASTASTSNSDTTQNPVHLYSSAGTYIISLTVTDNEGNRSSVSTAQIHVS